VTLPLKLAHQRYIQQAGWTQKLRRHIFTRAGLPNAHRLLEIGCGTGAVLSTLNHSTDTHLFGVDIDRPSLRKSREVLQSLHFTNGDAHSLPFDNGVFDISFFHFVLLWLTDPVAALVEARRVTRQGGAIIAFAEPDYSQRATSNPAFFRLGAFQAASLRTQGANPDIGSRLGELFKLAGIEPLEFGQLELDPTQMAGNDLDLELEVLKSDLAATMPTKDLDQLLSSIEPSDLSAFSVPTFYCWGRVA
jgi:SAM-dependent methyltransferase